MFKKLISTFSILFVMASVSYGQDWSNVNPEKDIIKPWIGYIATGSNGMTFNSASAPTVFGLKVGALLVASPLPDIPGVIYDYDGYLPISMGIWVAGGTMGFEGYFRYFPVEDLDQYVFGLKYEFTKLLPLPPGFPVSLAGYFDYSSTKFKYSSDLEMSNLGFGALVGADVLFLNVYARLGYELASGDFEYDYLDPQTLQFSRKKVSPESNGVRLAAGARLFLLDFEFGFREEAYFGAGISFGI